MNSFIKSVENWIPWRTLFLMSQISSLINRGNSAGLPHAGERQRELCACVRAWMCVFIHAFVFPFLSLSVCACLSRLVGDLFCPFCVSALVLFRIVVVPTRKVFCTAPPCHDAFQKYNDAVYAFAVFFQKFKWSFSTLICFISSQFFSLATFGAQGDVILLQV